jgi:ComF family protein
MSIIKNYLEKLSQIVSNFLVPEDKQIQKLLNLPSGVMRELLPGSPVYSRDICVLFDYQHKMVRALVKAVKYKNNQNLTKRIAEYLYEEIMEISQDVILFEGTPPLLLPMPMSKQEKRNRGFNQCEELVKEIEKLSGGGRSKNISVSYNTLKKIRETERQNKLGRAEREKNLKNSMSVQIPTLSKFKTVIVLDDVFTTGATLAEARRTLTSAGFSRVIGLFIAH